MTEKFNPRKINKEMKEKFSKNKSMEKEIERLKGQDSQFNTTDGKYN